MNAEPQKRGPEIEFHFHDDLAHLVTKRGSGVVRHAVAYRASAKDAVEAQGVPHTEVGLLLFDGRVTDFTQTLTDVGRMDVYGWVLPEELPQDFRLLPPPPEVPRFLLDVHLGRLAAYLRLLGFDSQYSPEDPGDGRMVERALVESRVLLTCDRGLLMRAAV